MSQQFVIGLWVAASAAAKPRRRAGLELLEVPPEVSNGEPVTAPVTSRDLCSAALQ